MGWQDDRYPKHIITPVSTYYQSDRWCGICVAMVADKPLAEAIRRAGGVRALARQLRMAHVPILRWKKAPATRVLAIEHLTGVSRYKLRPDVYGPTPIATAKQDA